VQDSSAAQFELCIDGSDAVPSAAGTPALALGPHQTQTTDMQLASTSDGDMTAVQRQPTKPQQIDIRAADEQPPRKR
jgi:hypothetical protein